MVLGLSLTSDDVVWVLVDAADGTVMDHDVIEIHSDTETAGAAARGAHAIATNGGFDVDVVRLTWSDEVVHDGLRLRARLSCLGFAKVEAVPFSSAIAVMVHPDTEPGLALAYGAAVAKVNLCEAITVPIVAQLSARRGFSRKRIAAAVLGAAALAALGGLLLTSGSVPPVEQTATAAAAQSRPDPGWVAVPAPSDSAANTVRKVVDSLEEATQEAAEPEAAPVRQVVPVEPESAAAEPVAVPMPAPTGVPHLPGAEPHLPVPPDAALAAPLEAPIVVPPDAGVVVPLPVLPAERLLRRLWLLRCPKRFRPNSRICPQVNRCRPRRR